MAIHVVGVVGFGNISIRHRSNLKLLYPEVFIVALSASGRVPTENINDVDQIVSNIDELIGCKPDFVLVASPAPLHSMHAELLIKSGIPVLIEKPVTANYAGAIQLQDIANEYDATLAVGYCLRYLPSAIKMKELIESDFLGPIYNCFINMGQYLPSWRKSKDYQASVSANKSLGGGVLLELSHELDYAQWLLGSLKLESSILRNSKELDVDVEELADLVFSNCKGTICNIHLDFLQKSPQRMCFFIGKKGRLDWDLLLNTISYTSPAGIEVLYSDVDWDRNDMYLNMLRDFNDLMGGKPNECVGINQAVRSIKLVDEVKVNAVWGKVQ